MRPLGVLVPWPEKCCQRTRPVPLANCYSTEEYLGEDIDVSKGHQKFECVDDFLLAVLLLNELLEYSEVKARPH